VVASVEELQAMQGGDYILHARGGKFARVGAQKTSLPLDPAGHTQRLELFIAPDGVIHAAQCSILSRSSDRGASWTHLRRAVAPAAAGQVPEPPDDHFLNFRVLPNGDWIRARTNNENGAKRASASAPLNPSEVSISVSSSEGTSWRETCRIGGEMAADQALLGTLEVDGQGSVIVIVAMREDHPAAEGGQAGEEREVADMKTYMYKSTDGGQKFGEPSLIGRWAHETNLAVLSPTHYLATIRYQPLAQEVADQGHDTMAIDGGTMTPEQHMASLKAKGQVSKVVFVSDSVTAGETWSRNRQVTTGGGQCHAHAVGLGGDTVVMVTDHRYPRQHGGARALVSHDGGRRWEDEVYYLSSAIIGGFARTVSLDDCGTMLTLTGTCNPAGGFDEWQSETDTPTWDTSVGLSPFQIVRWSL
jgi:hypothetical protein